MSRTVDERVVSMRFDNDQFESGIRESMSTLERFENSLDMAETAKNFDSVNKSISKFDVSPLSKGLDAAKSAFDSFGNVAMNSLKSLANGITAPIQNVKNALTRIIDETTIGALRKIGADAINGVIQGINSVTVAPVKQGFSEYELKMGAVQTMMASTGEDLKTINGYLEQLNQYADKTIYSFSDMTQNISKFTNNGVKLDKAVAAIKGVSNVAAVAGANSNEASRAMYNFSQALSQGSVKLIDWKSIQNANMATVEFKQSLLDTAVALGTVRKEGSSYVTTTTDMQGKVSEAFDANKLFNESLSHSWMTTDVLVQTLELYSNDIRDMTDAEVAEYEAKLKSMGFTEDQIKQYEELGKKAADAAQDVKTFSMLMDTIGEAVGSGWSQTFELIFGDFEQAKSLWTGINNTISPIIDGISDARNKMLGEWINAGGKEAMFGGISQAFKNLETIINTVKEAFHDVFPVEQFNILKTAVKTADGTWTAMAGKGANTLYTISNAVKDFSDKIKALLENETTLGKFKSAFRGIFSFADIIKQFAKSLGEVFGPGIISGVKTLLGWLLDGAAIIGDWITALDKSIKEGQKFTNFFTTIRDGVGGAIAFIQNTFSSAGEAIKTFWGNLKSLASFKINLPDMSPLTTFLDKVNERLNPLNILKRVFGAVAVAANAIGTAIFGSLNKIFPSLEAHLKEAGDGISEFIAGLQDKFSNIIPVVKNFASAIWNGLKTIGEGLYHYFFEEGNFNVLIDIVNTGIFASLAGGINSLAKSFANMPNGVTGILTTLKQTIGSWNSKSVGESFKAIKDGVVDTLTALQNKVKGNIISELARSIGILAIALFALALLDTDKLAASLGAITAMFIEMSAAMKFLDSSVDFKNGKIADAGANMMAMSIGLLFMVGALKSMSKLDWGAIERGLVGIAGCLTEMYFAMKYFSKLNIGNVAGEVIAFSIAMIFMGSAFKIFASVGWDQLGAALIGFGSALAGVIITFKLLENTKNTMEIASSMLVFSLAIGVLALSMSKFSKIKDTETALLGFAGAIAGLIIAFKMLNDKDAMKISVSMLFMAMALNKMAKVLLKIGGISWDQLIKGMLGISVMMAAITLSLDNIKNEKVLEVAAAMMVFGIALNIMAAAMLILGKLKIDQLVISLVALAGVLGIFTVFSNLSNGGDLIELAAAMLIMGAALTSLGIGLKVLSGVGIGEAIKSLLILAGAFTVLGVAAYVLAPVIGVIEKLSVSLLLLGVAMVAIGLGVTAIVGAFATFVALIVYSEAAVLAAIELLIVGILTIIASSAEKIIEVVGVVIQAFLKAIHDNIPLIVQTLLDTIVETLEALSKFFPQIVSLLLQMIDMLLVNIATYVPTIVGYIADMITNIINTLAEKIPGFVDAVVNLIRTFIDSVINALNGLDMENLKNGIIAFGLMTVFMVGLAGVTVLAPAAMAGVLAVGAVIAELTLVLAAIGALSQIPGVTWLVGEGTEFVELLGASIGKFFGAIVGGFAEGIVGQLPKIGQSLSEFMLNASGFIIGARAIKKESMEGVKTLIEALLLLTASEIAENLTSWFTGGTSLADFGDQLIEFGPKLTEFSETVADVKAEQVEGAAKATLALADMAKSLPNSGGLVAMITGDNSLADFGEELKEYGPNLTAFIKEISKTTVNESVVKGAVEATLALANMAKEIPNAGGLVSLVTGDNSLSDFGRELSQYGKKLVRFAGDVKDVKNAQVEGAITATGSLIEMAAKVPNEGGLVSMITGDNSLSQFGKHLSKYGPYLAKFAKEVSGVTYGDVEGAIKASSGLVDMAKDIPKEGGIADRISGSNGLGKFGKELVTFGGYLEKYCKKIAGIGFDNVDGSVDAVKKLVGMASDLNNTGGLASVVTGNASLSKFGEELKAFAPNLVTFIKKMRDNNIGAMSASGATQVTKELIETAKLLNEDQSAINKIAKANNLATFGEELASYGGSLSSFASQVTGVTGDSVQGAADATTTLIEIAKAAPKEDGWVQKVIGTNSLATFGAELADYGGFLKSFADDVTGITEDQVSGAAAATTALTTMARDIPFDGGLVEKIAGDQSLSGFGAELDAYGPYLKGFVKNVDKVDLNGVQGAIDATTALIGMANDIPETGLTALVGGKVPLSMFGEEIKEFSRPFKRYYKNVSEIGADVVQKSRYVSEALVLLAKDMPDSIYAINLTDVGDALASFGRGVWRYYNKIEDIDIGTMHRVTDELIRLAELKDDITSINGLGLISLAKGLNGLSTDSVTTFVDSFTTAGSELNKSSSGMIDGAISGISSKTSDLLGSIKIICTAAIVAFKTYLPANTFRNIVETQILKPIMDAFNSKRGMIQNAVTGLCSSITSLFKRGIRYNEFFDIGKNVTQGLLDGMRSKFNELQAMASRMAQLVSMATRMGLKVHSPSEEFYDIGENVVLGLIKGIDAYVERVRESGAKLSDATMDSMNEAIKSVTDETNEMGLDTQPVIRPVLDLTDVQNGYKEIGSLFDQQYKVDASAKVGRGETSSINPAQIDKLEEAIRSINNHDVVSEIGALRNDVVELQAAMSNLQVVMNTGALVGQIMEPMDQALGSKALRNQRGRY